MTGAPVTRKKENSFGYAKPKLLATPKKTSRSRRDYHEKEDNKKVSTNNDFSIIHVPSSMWRKSKR